MKRYHVSKQLFDKDNTIVYSAYVNTSDAWVNDSGSYSIKNPCLGNTTYTLSVGTSLPIFRIYESSDSDVEPTTYASGGTPISRIIRGENLSQYSFTTDANSVYIIFQGSASALNDWINSLMLNEGSTALPYEPYGNTWQTKSPPKYGTATETIQSGDTIYADGQPITTYMLKGNEEHTGTPSPQNPVMPNGVGNKTANLFDYKAATYGTWTNSNGSTISAGYAARSASLNAETITVSCNGETKPYSYSIVWLDGNDTFISREHVSSASMIALPQTFTPPNNAVKYYMQVANGADTSNPITESQLAGYKIMLNTGSTAKPYEPYGYKIPISSAQGSAVNYLGSVQSTRQIKKLVLTGEETIDRIVISENLSAFAVILADSAAVTSSDLVISTHYNAGTTPQAGNIYIGSSNNRLVMVDSYGDSGSFRTFLATQYANGTPVIVWYPVAATTGTVNEPLMKIGTYADSISNAVSIPTTDGANSITVDTTVQPSEFTATWTGWHDSSVKEYDGSQWQ